MLRTLTGLIAFCVLSQGVMAQQEDVVVELSVDDATLTTVQNGQTSLRWPPIDIDDFIIDSDARVPVSVRILLDRPVTISDLGAGAESPNNMTVAGELLGVGGGGLRFNGEAEIEFSNPAFDRTLANGLSAGIVGFDGQITLGLSSTDAANWTGATIDVTNVLFRTTFTYLTPIEVMTLDRVEFIADRIDIEESPTPVPMPVWALALLAITLMFSLCRRSLS